MKQKLEKKLLFRDHIRLHLEIIGTVSIIYSPGLHVKGSVVSLVLEILGAESEVVLGSLIKSPDNTKKILITFTFFYLTEAQYNENEEDEDYGELICNFQNVTLSG